MPKFHVVTLDEAQRLLLEKTVRSGTASARTVTRARILLKSDTGDFGPSWIDTEIADALDVSQSTVERTRKRAVLEGIEAAIVDRPRLPKGGKLDGAAEARLIALRCSPAPHGRDRWTLHLLAARFSAQDDLPVSHELVRQTLTQRTTPASSSGVSIPSRDQNGAGEEKCLRAFKQVIHRHHASLTAAGPLIDRAASSESVPSTRLPHPPAGEVGGALATLVHPC